MPTNLTLKGVPDEVYAQLKRSADLHRRSLNSEAIAQLEDALMPRRLSAAERLARARDLRSGLEAGAFTPSDIDQAKQQGRA
jgi:plasmid stability protein